MIFETVEELLGNTPLLKTRKLFKENNLYLKLEYFNPTGSIKDRPAFEMIKNLIKNGEIVKGQTIIVPTSGNAGVGVALACKLYGLNCICIIIDEISKEKKNLLIAYGAEVIQCDSSCLSENEGGYVWVAKELQKYLTGAILLDQFKNENNANAHYKTTGREIYNDLHGNIDYFFAAIGSGGTISGTAKYLKEKNKNTKVIAIDPKGGIYYSYFNNKPMIYKDHTISSISDSFVPDILKDEYIDEVFVQDDLESHGMCHEVCNNEGLLIGHSAGFILAGIKRYIEKYDIKGKNIVTVVPDSGNRYLDTVYNFDNLIQNKMHIQDENHINLELENFCQKYTHLNVVFINGPVKELIVS